MSLGAHSFRTGNITTVMIPRKPIRYAILPKGTSLLTH